MGRTLTGVTRLFSARTWSKALPILCLVFFFTPLTASARMQVMTNTQLANVTGTGFSKFTLVNGVALAQFDIRASTWTEMDSMKLGHYNNGIAPGWDQDWTGVSMGSQAKDLVMQGFYFKASFANITDPATRKLNSVTIGWKNVTGTITADFSSYSGYLKGATYSRGNLGTRTVTLNNEPMSLTIDVAKGIEVSMGN